MQKVTEEVLQSIHLYSLLVCELHILFVLLKKFSIFVEIKIVTIIMSYLITTTFPHFFLKFLLILLFKLSMPFASIFLYQLYYRK